MVGRRSDGWLVSGGVFRTLFCWPTCQLALEEEGEEEVRRVSAVSRVNNISCMRRIPLKRVNNLPLEKS